MIDGTLYLLNIVEHAPVAQLDRVPGYELGGREFESLRAHQICCGFTRSYSIRLNQFCGTFAGPKFFYDPA